MKTAIHAFAFMLAGLAGTAQASSVVEYATLSSFEAAVAGQTVTLETFTDSAHFPITTGVLNAATNLPAIGLLPGMIQAGVSYSTPVGDGNFFNIDCCAPNGPFLDNVTSNGPLTITFDHPTKGFSFTSGYFNRTTDVTINFLSGMSYHASYSANQDSFYGFVSGGDITSVIVGGGQNSFTFAIDDFRFTSAVPEPASYGMLLAGLALTSLMARRRRKST